MILLTVNHVSKAFVTRSVLEDASLVLQTGQRMGVVGVNGSGKSTLFRMIAGELEPDAGSITLLKGARVGMLTQQADITSDYTVQEELERVFEPVRRMEARLREMEEQMAALHHDAEAFAQLSRDYSRLMDRFEDAGGYEWPSRIQGVLAGLGFADDKRNQKAALLSGGEKTRLCLARLLLTQPELLMLDEPTNHLDLASTQWLEDTLRKYRGSVMVISHDRYFMNSVCDCMAEVCMRRIDQYEGNYDQFAQKRQANLERRLIANLPKNNVTRRAVKVCVAIVSIFTLFAMYLQCISRIDTDFNKYAVVDSPDGKREVVIMRANLTISKSAQEGEDAQDKQYTLYKAYPKLNAIFCDGRDNTDMIWLVNDPDAKLNYEWSDNGLRLYTEGNAMETTEADGTTHLLNEIDLTF